MRKLSILAFFAAAVIFTGCSQKEIDITLSGNKSSESALNGVNTNEQQINDTLAQRGDEGYFYTINDEKKLVKNIYFGFDKYDLTTEMQAVSKENAANLAGIQSGTIIKIEGNCDEWGTDEYNYALGLKRAKVVKEALVLDGIPSESISVVSYGESNPTCTDKTDACWAKNRRSEHKLVK